MGMTPRVSLKITKLRIKAPITAGYERALIACGVRYSTQKEHWRGWLFRNL
jgi:hypothetical protein